MTNLQWFVSLIWILGIAVQFQYETGWMDMEDEGAEEERGRLFTNQLLFLAFGLLNIFINQEHIRFIGAFCSLFLFSFIMYTVVDYFTECPDDELEKEKEDDCPADRQQGDRTAERDKI